MYRADAHVTKTGCSFCIFEVIGHVMVTVLVHEIFPQGKTSNKYIHTDLPKAHLSGLAENSNSIFLSFSVYVGFRYVGSGQTLESIAKSPDLFCFG